MLRVVEGILDVAGDWLEVFRFDSVSPNNLPEMLAERGIVT
ncbi:MAG: hypothetical protein M2R45_04397 [Verrucomicrobia subdivision 3 bacterium]|nr:hypothetical protein [Limisphaerales bacterium]